MPKLTHKKLLEILHYDSDTGEFTWLVSRGVKAGTIAGCRTQGHVNRNNEKYALVPYWIIQVYGRRYPRGHLVWFYMTGKWPKDEIDHRDLNSLNDRWDNLREATHAQNQMNRHIFKNNRSGYKGVHRQGGKWRAMISIDGHNRHIGYFDQFEDAKEAYIKAARENYADYAYL